MSLEIILARSIGALVVFVLGIPRELGWSNSLCGGRDEDRDTRQRIIANRLDISKKIGID